MKPAVAFFVYEQDHCHYSCYADVTGDPKPPNLLSGLVLSLVQLSQTIRPTSTAVSTFELATSTWTVTALKIGLNILFILVTNDFTVDAKTALQHIHLKIYIDKYVFQLADRPPHNFPADQLSTPLTGNARLTGLNRSMTFHTAVTSYLASLTL